MADNISLTPGTGATFGADEVIDGTLGTVKVGFGKIMDGTLDSTNKLVVDSTGALSNNQTRIGSATIDTNSGVKSAGTQRVVLATDQPQLTNALKVDGSAVTQPVSLASVPSHAVTNAGTFAVQVTSAPTTAVTGTFWQATQPVSGTVSVTGVATATNQTGGGQKTQIVDGSGSVIASTNNTMNINATAQPAGGYTPNKLISAATTNATSVKASAGTLGFLSITNTGSAPAFVKFYNKASAPTVGTDTPLLTFMVPANATAANGAGNNPFIPSEGLAFGTGIAFAITGAAADSDTTAVAASQVIVNYGTA